MDGHPPARQSGVAWADVAEGDGGWGPAESILWRDDSRFEFGHTHPFPDSSMHLQLPLELTALAIAGGRAEPHSVVWQRFAPVTSVMLSSLRKEQELEADLEPRSGVVQLAMGQPLMCRHEPQPIE
jgi:hypothetical protein